MFKTFRSNVKEVKECIKDYWVELKDDTAEYFDNHYELIPWIANGIIIVGLTGLGVGIKLANLSMIDVYKNGVQDIADGTKFNRKMNFDEWTKYIEFLYSKEGKRKKNRLNYLKERGFID